MSTIETTLSYTPVTPEMLTLFVQHKLSASAINLYIALHYDVDSSHTEPLRVETIAEALGISRSSVYKALTKLTEADLFVPVWGHTIIVNEA